MYYILYKISVLHSTDTMLGPLDRNHYLSRTEHHHHHNRFLLHIHAHHVFMQHFTLQNKAVIQFASVKRKFTALYTYRSLTPM